jgi:hypothetical protein
MDRRWFGGIYPWDICGHNEMDHLGYLSLNVLILGIIVVVTILQIQPPSTHGALLAVLGSVIFGLGVFLLLRLFQKQWTKYSDGGRIAPAVAREHFLLQDKNYYMAGV